MGNGKSKLSDEQITEVFKSVDADDNGVLDPYELMAAANKLIDRQVTSKEIETMVHKYNLHEKEDGLNLEEFCTMVKELDVAKPEEHSDTLFEVDFPGQLLGFSVKNGEDENEGKVVVSKIKSPELEARNIIQPNYVVYAVNGVAIAKKNVTTHEALASQVIKIKSRPITITFEKPSD